MMSCLGFAANANREGPAAAASHEQKAPEGTVVRVNDPAHRAWLAKLIARYGSGAHGISLAPKFRVFSVPSIDGGVAFIRRAGCSVVFGDPLCRPEDKKALALAFREFCKQRHWPLVYIAGSDTFSYDALDLNHGFIRFGTEHVINPLTNPLNQRARRPLRQAPLSPVDPGHAEAVAKLKREHKRAQETAQRAASAEHKRRLAEAGPGIGAEQAKAIAQEAFKDAVALREANRRAMQALVDSGAPQTPASAPRAEAESQICRNLTNIQHCINAAVRSGITITPYDAQKPDPDKEAQIAALTERWLAARQGPQVFAGIIDPFASRSTGRWFLAEADVTVPDGVDNDNNESGSVPRRTEKQVVGLITLLRLADHTDAEGRVRTGWLIDHLVSAAKPRGISQMLVRHVVETLAAEGTCDRLTWGIAAQPTLGDSEGLSRWATSVAKSVHARSNNAFHFENKVNFRNRFMPEHEEALNLVFYPAKVGLHQVVGIMKAMNVGFGISTITAMFGTPTTGREAALTSASLDTGLRRLSRPS